MCVSQNGGVCAIDIHSLQMTIDAMDPKGENVIIFAVQWHYIAHIDDLK